MYTVSDFRQSGMPVLAEVSTPEAGYEFATRMGFRESACVLPKIEESEWSYYPSGNAAVVAADRDPLTRYLPGVN